MAIVRPFNGIRPAEGKETRIASLPYDVMNREEAKRMAGENELSFLHVVRAEIDVPDEISAYDDSVYEGARNRLSQMIKDGNLVQDDDSVFYIYRQIMDGRVQTGLVGCASIDDYMNGIIKKHEFTREAKEVDRIKHFDTCDANTAPIFLTYRKNDQVNQLINDWIKFNKPVYNFTSEDEITHIVWKISEPAVNDQLQGLFESINYLYIADGHHRSASAVKVGKKRREENPNYTGEEEFNYFLSVIFPDEDLFIMDYNRVVKDLNGHSKEEFMKAIEEKFEVKEYESNGAYSPRVKHEFGMYLGNQWYRLRAKEDSFDIKDTVNSLDAAILQNNLLHPILGIEDPRKDERIDFVGGIRGLKELERRVSEDMEIAFSMCPTTIEDLMSVADDQKVMPPKSTWFEPKLRSGLFVHKLD